MFLLTEEIPEDSLGRYLSIMYSLHERPPGRWKSVQDIAQSIGTTSSFSSDLSSLFAKSLLLPLCFFSFVFLLHFVTPVGK